jgi:hypothetical protein
VSSPGCHELPWQAAAGLAQLQGIEANDQATEPDKTIKSMKQ